MPRIFRSGKQFWVLFGLLAVSFRILTGAPEAQVNFSSLIVDQHINESHKINQINLLAGGEFKNNADANSIPEKHHTYSTYKKYLSPDNPFATLRQEIVQPNFVVPKIFIAQQIKKSSPTFRPTSHSPPAVVSALTHTHTTTTGNSVVLEKNFGEFKVNNNIGRVGRLKL